MEIGAPQICDAPMQMDKKPCCLCSAQNSFILSIEIRRVFETNIYLWTGL